MGCELLDGTNNHLRKLQEGLDEAISAIHTLCKDGGRNRGNIQKLMSRHEQTAECLETFRKGQKTNDARLRNMEQDLVSTTNLATSLQNKVEKDISSDICSLQDDLIKTNHIIRELSAEERTNKENLQEGMRNLKATNTDLQAFRDKLTKSNTVVHIAEESAADNTSGFKSAKGALEALNANVKRVFEDLEKAKRELSDVQSGVKTNTANIKKSSNILDRALSRLEAAQTKLDEAGGGLDATRRSFESTQGRLQGLTENQYTEQRALGCMKGELVNVMGTANHVRNGLKEMNIMVLPNLDTSLSVVSKSPVRINRERHIRKVNRNANQMVWI